MIMRLCVCFMTTGRLTSIRVPHVRLTKRAQISLVGQQRVDLITHSTVARHNKVAVQLIQFAASGEYQDILRL